MTRVVLVVSRHGVTDPANRLAIALDRIAALGYDLIAVIGPEQAREALRMVLDDLADLVLVARPEDFSLVRQVADLDDRGGRRTHPALRPVAGEKAAHTRRPQPVQPAERVEPARTEHVRRAQLDRHQRTSIIRRTG